jgi:hypothetical protein
MGIFGGPLATSVYELTVAGSLRPTEAQWVVVAEELGGGIRSER